MGAVYGIMIVNTLQKNKRKKQMSLTMSDTKERKLHVRETEENIK